MKEILTPISAVHSPVIFFLLKEKTAIRGKGFWKFNSSLTKDQNYIIGIKKLIPTFSNKNESLFNRQLKCELLNMKLENIL